MYIATRCKEKDLHGVMVAEMFRQRLNRIEQDGAPGATAKVTIVVAVLVRGLDHLHGFYPLQAIGVQQRASLRVKGISVPIDPPSPAEQSYTA